MKRQRFAIKSKHFSLYQAFKTEAEKLGWTYLDSFCKFEPEKAEAPNNCLFFSYKFESAYGTPAFSLSYSPNQDIDTYWLETDWNSALAHAKQTVVLTKRVGNATVTSEIEVSVAGKGAIGPLTVPEALQLNEALGALLEQLNQF